METFLFKGRCWNIQKQFNCNKPNKEILEDATIMQIIIITYYGNNKCLYKSDIKSNRNKTTMIINKYNDMILKLSNKKYNFQSFQSLLLKL